MIEDKMRSLVSLLNKDNVYKIKKDLIKYLDILTLSLDEKDEELSTEKINRIYNIMERRKNFRSENKIGTNLILFNEFIDKFYSLLDDIKGKGYLQDSVEIASDFLKGIGGINREFKLLVIHEKSEEYVYSKNHLYDLKKEIESLLYEKVHYSIYEEIYTIVGLTYSIRFDLEEKCKEYGRIVLSLLELEDEISKEELKKVLHNEYALELQRRMYYWDEITVGLKNHYYIEKLYENREDM
ncbi:hypothetical protein [Clostridium tetani]|uniref:hypothetical protein n=1 Tax=Clostridium tetani TaxID=1513 RepID=UPI000D201A14|nr:hypothetical protein [Clostridium tetani]AVP54305.1 hypothetical protein C3B72_03875 [Clostridium tetani]RXM69098.1 hypothetical protein DP139_10735 [Clostridium tetani]BDR84243.1 hypothetical protein K254310026_16540 [Clostridium tetani]